jgi:predicted small lipoprotein YifL
VTVRRLVLLVALLAIGCGRKGPPLPPLVKIPVAPADLTAERRGDTVNLSFTVPSTNTDNTRPANVARVDVYAITGSTSVSDDELLKQGTMVASVDVKAPRDPNQTIEPDDPEDAVEPLEGSGLDQGAVARVGEKLMPSAAAAESRTYVGVGITTKGRQGPMSKRVAVPLGPAPPAPTSLRVTYTESSIAITWGPPPATSTDGAAPAISYHVYEVSASGDTQLTKTPIAETSYADARIAWGAMRCYAVRAVVTVESLTVQSEETMPGCVTLVDTFPPAAPTGLNAVSSEGAISLIWDSSPEADVAGYIVLRGTAPGDMLVAVTSSPLRETTFRDMVQAGIRYVYAVQAVDKAGNVGAASNRVEEAAR